MNFKEFIKTKPNPKKHTFGEFIWQRREELGYSARELSSKLEISLVYLRDIEQGYRPMPRKLINQITTLLDIVIEPENEQDFEDLIYLSRNECTPELIQYLIENKKARQAISYAIENNLSAQDVLDRITAKDNEKSIEKENYEMLVNTYLSN